MFITLVGNFVTIVGIITVVGNFITLVGVITSRIFITLVGSTACFHRHLVLEL